MTVFFRSLQVLDWLIAASWMGRVLVWRHMLPRVPDLTRNDYGSTLRGLPSLTVIVPARNEAANISATLKSLLAAHAITLEIIAVDDRSTDQTATLMEKEARLADQNFRVLRVTELPSGWLGKTHAMALAAQQATSDWLLFTDADVVFHHDALRRALAYVVDSGADHLVLLPTLVLESWGERMMVAFLQALSIWAVRPWRVADSRAKRDAIGVGAFNMIRRQVYAELGGWEALRMEVVEDLALGRRVKERGYAQRVALGLDLVQVRWARGAFGVVENLTKNLFALLGFRPERLVGLAFGVAMMTLFPLFACLGGRGLWWPTITMVVAFFLAYERTGRYHHFSSAQVVFFPLATLLFLYALMRSMLLALWRGGITWRGTFYSLRELRAWQKNAG
jgi:cellulose synthase/poly-beta-1,6-N-acetylglucosamine synthase-like glycosyltransferase